MDWDRLPRGLSSKEIWVTKTHWPVLKTEMRLPPGMTVEIVDRYNSKTDWSYTSIVTELATKDAYGGGDTTITLSRAVYNSHTSVQRMIEAVGQVVEELWSHELREWLKVGDQWLLGDPHG